jgi:peptidoglycan-associated lipoprotein
MKRLFQVGLVGLVAALALASAGCKTRPKNLTALPSSEGRAGSGTDMGVGKPLPPTQGGNTGGNAFNGVPSNARPYNPNPNPNGTDLPPVTNLDPNRGNTALPTENLIDGRREDREMFRGNTVYFEFDKSAVKKSEQAKVAAVGEYLKSNPDSRLQIEGHCDERGTEGYNLALGERRALAIRETLLNLGVPAANVTTVSFGEARPADPSQNDAAYAKNRRGEFILLVPSGSPVR